MPIFKKACKTDIKMRLGMYGPSGAGKTISSLAIAEAFGGPIALIDSEHGSSNRYADMFDFDVLDISDRRTLSNYITAIEAAGLEGYKVCIIDSLSHAWLTVLEEIDRLPEKQKMLGWAKVNPQLANLKDVILKSPCHVIATLRAKTEWTMDRVNGKIKPQKVGKGPVFRDGIDYEFDVFGYISEGVLEIQKSRCPGLQDQGFVNPGKDFAELLKTWISEVPEPTSEPTGDRLKVVSQWKTPEMAIEWAYQRLPKFSRDHLQEAFNSLHPDPNGKRAIVWYEYVEDMADKEKAMEDFEL